MLDIVTRLLTHCMLEWRRQLMRFNRMTSDSALSNSSCSSTSSLFLRRGWLSASDSGLARQLTASLSDVGRWSHSHMLMRELFSYVPCWLHCSAKEKGDRTFWHAPAGRQSCRRSCCMHRGHSLQQFLERILRLLPSLAVIVRAKALLNLPLLVYILRYSEIGW